MYGQMTAGSLDLHRHAGHSAGHLRDLRRAAPASTSAARCAAGWCSPAGLGGMGGAQPLAVTMNGGVVLGVEVDPAAHRAPARDRLRRSMMSTPRRGDGAGRGGAATAAARSPSAWSAMPPRYCPSWSAAASAGRGHRPDPRPRRAERLRARRADRSARPLRCGARTRSEYVAPLDGVHGASTCGRCWTLQQRGRGDLRLRQQHPRQARRGGRGGRLRLPRLRAGVHPAAVLRGQGAVPLGGAVRRPGGHLPHRPRPCSRCSRRTRLHRWIRLAREKVQFQGLPARICWLGYGERAKAGLAI